MLISNSLLIVTLFPLLTLSSPLLLEKRQASFLQCLSSATPKIVTSSSSSSDFQKLSTSYNLRLPITPLVVTLPKSAKEVSTIVNCARQNSHKVSVRGGGHSYNSQGLGGTNGHVVIDLQNIHDVVYDSKTTLAQIGGGARLGNIAQKLYDAGKRAIPHGTCPGVGLGHALYGGYGNAGRFWGLMVDNIEQVEVVTADGQVRIAKKNYNGDLFWALRGAGGSFGVVTKFWFRTYAAPESNVNYSYRFSGLTPASATSIFLAIQAWVTTSAPKELSVGISLFQNSGTQLEFSGVYHNRNKNDFDNLFKSLLSKLPSPSSTDVSVRGWIDTLVRYSGQSSLWVPETGYDQHNTFFAKSLVTPASNPYNANTLTSFFTYANEKGTQAANSGLPWFVIINLYGGANSVITNPALSGESSYGHRDSLWNWQFYATINSLTQSTNTNAINFITGFHNSAKRVGDGAYANYQDPTLSRQESQSLYYGGQSGRLGRVKAKWDKGELFFHPHSISPAK